MLFNSFYIIFLRDKLQIHSFALCPAYLLAKQLYIMPSRQCLGYRLGYKGNQNMLLIDIDMNVKRQLFVP